LIRGLASSNDGARQGFSMTLIEVIIPFNKKKKKKKKKSKKTLNLLL